MLVDERVAVVSCDNEPVVGSRKECRALLVRPHTVQWLEVFEAMRYHHAVYSATETHAATICGYERSYGALVPPHWRPNHREALALVQERHRGAAGHDYCVVVDVAQSRNGSRVVLPDQCSLRGDTPR